LTYFGESKKGGLRMWNRKVYEVGGLAMPAAKSSRPPPASGPRPGGRRPQVADPV